MWLEDFGGSKLEKDAPWILAQLEPKHPQSWNFTVIVISLIEMTLPQKVSKFSHDKSMLD